MSQSNREVSFGAYAELQFNPANAGQFYAGLAAWRINWPGPGGPYFFTNPAAEVDITGGWRNTWGAFALDLGFIYYYYPSESFNGFTNDSDFWEIDAKAGYDITSDLNVGLNVFYTPDLLHYSKSFNAVAVLRNATATYASVTGKWTTPWKSGDFGAYISGELGHWWIDSAGFLAAGVALSGAPYTDPSYTYANIGLAITWKALTLDFRFHGNDMSVSTCTSFLLSAVGNPSNKWCGNAFIVALKSRHRSLKTQVIGLRSLRTGRRSQAPPVSFSGREFRSAKRYPPLPEGLPCSATSPSGLRISRAPRSSTTRCCR